MKKQIQKYHQKFHFHDLVRVAKDLGPMMSHFPGKGEFAIVCGSYYDQYGGGQSNKKQFTLLFKESGRVSWYKEHQLTLVRENARDLYEEWRK